MEHASLRLRQPPAHRTSARRSFTRRQRRVSLCETLDRVLNKGAVIAGDLVVSVADVELLYIGLSCVVTSVETMRKWASEEEGRRVSGPVEREPASPASSMEEPAVRARKEA